MINWTVLQPQYRQAYVRELVEQGRVIWALFDEDGELVHASENRSKAFFKASDQELTIMLLN